MSTVPVKTVEKKFKIQKNHSMFRTASWLLFLPSMAQKLHLLKANMLIRIIISNHYVHIQTHTHTQSH